MTVGQLRRLLEGIPDDTPVVTGHGDFYTGTRASAALLSLYRTSETTDEYFDPVYIDVDRGDVPTKAFIIEEV